MPCNSQGAMQPALCRVGAIHELPYTFWEVIAGSHRLFGRTVTRFGIAIPIENIIRARHAVPLPISTTFLYHVGSNWLAFGKLELPFHSAEHVML